MKAQVIFIRFFLIVSSFSFFSAINAQETTPNNVQIYSQDLYNKNFRFSIGGGYAFRLGKIVDTGDPKIYELNKKLRHGFTIDADAQYFFKQNWGIGINANLCLANTSGYNITIPNLGLANSYKENQRIFYVGPSYVSREGKNKFLFTSNIGLGAIFFSDEIIINGVMAKGSETTIGLNAGLGAEYKVSNNTGIGLKLSYIMGAVNSLNFNGQSVKSDKPMSLSNLMLTAFVSF